jgi:hypothetical protein
MLQECPNQEAIGIARKKKDSLPISTGHERLRQQIEERYLLAEKEKR